MRTGLTSTALVLLAALCTAGFSPPQDAPAKPDARVIEISAERFSFNPSRIRVTAGTQLELRLVSEDTAHGFRILGTDVDIVIPKRGRGVTTVTFQPTAGEYTFECSQLCGAGHDFMRGVIIAVEAD